MSDWVHSLPVGAMAVVFFAITYAVTAVIYGLMTGRSPESLPSRPSRCFR